MQFKSTHKCIRFMECIGPFSNKMIRRHILSFQTLGLTPHFELSSHGNTYNFRKENIDPVTKKNVIRLVSANTGVVPAKQLAQIILNAASSTDRADVGKFVNMLSKCLVLDPNKRMNVEDALEHDLFRKSSMSEATSSE